MTATSTVNKTPSYHPCCSSKFEQPIHFFFLSFLFGLKGQKHKEPVAYILRHDTHAHWCSAGETRRLPRRVKCILSCVRKRAKVSAQPFALAATTLQPSISDVPIKIEGGKTQLLDEQPAVACQTLSTTVPKISHFSISILHPAHLNNLSSWKA